MDDQIGQSMRYDPPARTSDRGLALSEGETPCDASVSDDAVGVALARHGLRCTRQRRAVLGALRATQAHPTVEQLHAQVDGGVDNISLATIYNTLEALCRVGLAQRIYDGDGTARYDAEVRDHVHLYESADGALCDVDADLGADLLAALPASLLDRIEQRHGVKIEQIQIQLNGRPSSRER